MMDRWNISSWARLPRGDVSAPSALALRILPLPPRFNRDVDSAVHMKHGVYLKAEVIFHELLLRLDRREEATRGPAPLPLFFVPLYTGQLGSASVESGKRSSRLEEVDAAFASLPPTLWPSRSMDFIFVVTVDRGRCFQDDNVDRFRDATVLMYEGTASYPRSEHAGKASRPPITFPCHSLTSDVVIPPVTDLGAHAMLPARAPELRLPANTSNSGAFPWHYFTHRKILFAWRGSSSRTAWAAGGSSISHAAPAAAMGKPGVSDDAPLDVRGMLIQLYGRTHNATAARGDARTVRALVESEHVSAAAPRQRQQQPTQQPQHSSQHSSQSQPRPPHASHAGQSSRAAHHPSTSLRLATPERLPVLLSTRKVDKLAHYLELRRALFCLAPSGWALWTVRFFEAASLGCIPVTFLPQPSPLRMPFADELDYAQFSVNVPPRDVPRLRERLEAIAHNRSRLRALQRALWAARPAFDWSDTSERGAFHRTLVQVARRRGLLGARRGVRAQPDASEIANA